MTGDNVSNNDLYEIDALIEDGKFDKALEKHLWFHEVSRELPGMGAAACSAMERDYSGHLVGVEIQQEKAAQHIAAGRNVVSGDATNPDFWDRAPELIDGLEWVLLALPTHKANMNAALRLRERGV